MAKKYSLIASDFAGADGNTLQAVTDSSPLPVGAGGTVAAGQSGAAVNPVVGGFLDSAGNVQAESGKKEFTAIASGTFTTAQDSAVFTDDLNRGVYIFLNVTAASGTGGLTVILQAKDPISGLYANVYQAAAAVTATGLKLYLVYPGASSAGTETKGGALPRTWKIHINVGDASSYTYSVGVCTLP